MANRSHYTDEQKAEMVRLTQELHSARKAAKEIGCSYQTVLDYCRKAGLHLISVKEKSFTNKRIVVDGITFFWNNKGFYRGKTDHGRETLARYLYRKIHGCEMPKHYNICFKDGNKDNYSIDNIEFKSLEECKRLYCNEHFEEQVEKLNRGRENFIQTCKKNPLIRKRTLMRAVNTRRRNDPDNLSAKKAALTKRKNAEERGYYYTEETRARMSFAKKGKKKETLKILALGNEMAAIRKKMGIAV